MFTGICLTCILLFIPFSCFLSPTPVACFLSHQSFSVDAPNKDRLNLKH